MFIQCSNYDGSEIFRKIGDLSLNDDQIGFCLRTEDAREPSDKSLKIETIYPYARKSLQSVQVLKIVIQDTVLRRAPALKKIEVWGFPSFKNSKDDTLFICKLYRGITETEENTENREECSTEAQETAFNIPEEFLDSITHELLVMPFILPSGSIIDETTMEKHNKHEEIYGRLPSDPFTSLIFTSEHQPKFHEVLKIKLDEFKLRHSDEIEVKRSGRTLGIGKKQKSVESANGCYASNGHISKKIKLNSSSSSDLNSLISSIYKNKQVSVFTRPKETEKTNRSACCKKCNSENTSNVYRISSCNHLICKVCLLHQDSTCGACRMSFQSKDVTKLNL